MRVGVVGLGIMGAPMARNLLRAGHTVAVYNRTPARAESLVALGATAVASPAAVAAASDVVVTCVSDGPDVEQVVCGPDGVLVGAAAELLVIDMSTIAPAIARTVAARCAERGVAFLDAPVSGGEQGAIDGTLSIMVGGDAQAFERAAPVFAALGTRATHMGASGQGQMTKLVNQVVGAVTLAAVAEGVTLAARAGLEPGAVIEAVGSGAATSWMLTNLGPKMQRHDLAPGFMVRLQQKDLRLALGAASAVGAALPTTAVVHQLFAAVEARGDGALGTQALVTILEALAGLERS
ncbi:MAG TPA: NAD(P)-dependent oxidoreductase [Candidatus Binatia bacterium]|jgi:3-hydroxyisobutyrate dehydrogenase|nr:NAD(P)-dependent oxidoreductase [Candidatus Binatia bacterium]